MITEKKLDGQFKYRESSKRLEVGESENFGELEELLAWNVES
jgi:hypothetical protein